MRGYTGNGISNITKTGTSGLIDTYTITYTDGNTTTFTVTNGKGISSIVKTGSAGLIDNYRITYNDGTYFDYTVTNGQDGEVTEEELQDVFEQMSSELEDSTATGTSIDTTGGAYWRAKLGLSGNTEQASPNPSYPQDIRVVSGENSIKVQNKNYLDISKCVMGANNVSANTTVTYSTKTNRACTKFDVNPIYVKANTSYKIKKDTYYFSVAQIKSNNIVINDSGWKSADYTFTTNTNCEKIVLNFKKSNDANFDIDDFKQQQIQIEEGSTATSYIPHQEQNYPITLPTGMELAKIPNTNYIDEIDIKNKKLIKKTQKIASYNGETITTDYISTTGGLDIGATIYYGISPVETTITDTTLINQLNDIENNLKTYQGISHITQTNADLPFVLTLDYKKSNLLSPLTSEQKAEIVQSSVTQVETDIQPTITSIQNTANTAQSTAETAQSTANTAQNIAKGANQALSYSNYSAMITAFNNLANNVYKVGQNVMIITLEVPDLWISSIENTSQSYTYTTDSAFTTALATNGYVQVGYYKLSALETQKVDLTEYVSNTDYATSNKGGVFKVQSNYGVDVNNGFLRGIEKTYSSYNIADNVMFVSKGTLENVITGKNLETGDNKVTTISSSSTNTEYPSAKAVYDLFNSIVDGDEVSY